MARRTGERLQELDLLRFMAAMAVLFYHYTFSAGQWLDFHWPVLDQVTRYGFLGVDLFFMISGFVILMSASHRTLEGFVQSRFLRVYPLFWVVCSLSFLILLLLPSERLPMYPDWSAYLVNLTLLHELFDIRPVDGVYWSLWVELRFYGLISLLLLFRQLRGIEYYLAAWLLVAVLHYNGLSLAVSNLLLFPAWSPYFIAGCLFYLLRQRGYSRFRLGLLGLTLVMNTLYGLRRLTETQQAYGESFDPWVFVALLLGFYLLFLALIHGRLACLRVARAALLGSLTYPLYLGHQVNGYLLIERLQAWLPAPVGLLVLLSLMLFVSWLLARFVDPAIRAVCQKGWEALPVLLSPRTKPI